MTRAVVILSCAWLFTACGGDRKEECEKWKQGFNRVVEKVMASGQTVNTAADAKKAVAQMGEVRADLAAIEIDDGTLKGFQREYVEIAGRKVTNMQAAQAAQEKGDQAAWEAAARQAEANDAAEDAVTQRVIDYCRR